MWRRVRRDGRDPDPHQVPDAAARPDAGQEDPEEDPRELLVRRLLEHQKYKAAAELLHERETLREAQWLRPEAVWPPSRATSTSRSSRSTCSAC